MFFVIPLILLHAHNPTRHQVVKNEGVPYVQYSIVTSGGNLSQPVQVARRYGNFKSLHSLLEKTVNQKPLPRLPPTRWRRIVSEAHVTEKRARLQVYIQQLLAIPDMELHNGVRDFLGLKLPTGSGVESLE